MKRRIRLKLEHLSDRINPTAGLLDPTFGSDGKLITVTGSGSAEARDSVVQPDGKVVVVGHTWNGLNNDFALVRYHVDGTLDTSFGGTGKVMTAVGLGNDLARAVALQPDGKIVVAGYSHNGSNNDFAVVRYNANGTLDLTFDSDGKQTTAIGSSEDFIEELAIQSDGKIVVAGHSNNGSNYDFALARYNTDGTLDTTFDGDGKVVTPIGSSSEFIHGLALVNGGKILAAGHVWNGSNYDFAFVRYNTDGSRDTTLDSDGILALSIGSGDDNIASMAVQADGKVVVIGETWNGSNKDVVVARLLETGVLDNTFSGDGVQTMAFGSYDDLGRDLAIQPDGKIIVVGYTHNGGNQDFVVARLNADGTLESSLTTDYGLGDDIAQSVSLQADGRIVVVGRSWDGRNHQFAFARYNSNGAPDTSLSDGHGIVTTLPDNRSSFARKAVIQPDGKSVVAGWSTFGGNTQFAVTRYNTDGSLDSNFGGNGKLLGLFNPTHNSSIVNSIALQTDGKIVLGGYSWNGSNFDFGLARLNPDGTQDFSFSGDGLLTTAFGASNDYVNRVLIQTDGKIVAVGSTTNASGNLDFAVARYQPNGNLDSTFDTDGKQSLSFGSGDDDAYDAALQTNGAIVLVGRSVVSGTEDFAIARLTTAGALDTSFDTDGRQTITFGTASDAARSVDIHTDGKIVVGGDFETGSAGSQRDMAVARLTTSGALDTTFSTDGKQTIGLGNGNIDYTNQLEVQSDGKIVVVGTTYQTGSNTDFMLVRYTSAGVLDTSFDSDGIVISSVSNGIDDALGLTLQADNKIVVTGISISNGNIDAVIARYNSNGSLDTSFSNDGVRTTVFGNHRLLARSVAVQADGKIVAVGENNSGTNTDFAVVRYNVDGTLDTTFSGDGRLTTDFGSNNNEAAYSVAIQADGRIVVAGDVSNGANYDFGVVRYNVNGTLDTSFSGDGFLITPIGSDNDYVYSMAIQADGKIVVTGSSFVGANSDFAVARYNVDGTLDTTFSGDGLLTTPIGSDIDRVKSVAIQADGKIVVAGDVSNGANYDYAVARYNVNGTLDTTFSGDGLLITTLGSGNDYVYSVAIQADGRIVVAGDALVGGNYDFGVVRYNVDGTLDTTFSGDGLLTTPIGSSDDRVKSVAIQADGRIVVAGEVWNGANYDFAVARYNVDGTLDTTFSGDGLLTTPIGLDYDAAWGMALQADGRIVIAGYSRNESDNDDMAIIRVRGDNRAPVPVSTTFTLNEDTPFSVATPTYYLDPDSDVVNTVLLNAPMHGTVTLNPYGQFTYTPDANYSGTDTFSYRVSDSYGGTAMGSINLVVQPVNDNPTVVNDSISLPEDNGLTAINVLANDSIAPDSGEMFAITSKTNGANGVVFIHGGGASLLYQPNANFTGNDSFTYTVTDTNGGTSTATVNVTVYSVNDNPTAGDDAANLPEDSAATAIDVLGNDGIAPDTGEVLTITSKTNGTNGTVIITGGGTGLTYQPNANFTGTDSFTYTVGDGNSGTATATVTVNVTSVNDNPTVVTDNGGLPEDNGATAINVLANDSTLPDTGEVLTITSKTNGTNGTVVITGGGTGITYQPNANFTGTDSFTYTVGDGNSGTATATVNVSVTSVNDAPPAVNDTRTIAEDSGLTVINVLANDTGNVDTGETLTIAAVSAPTNGTISIVGNMINYTPNANFTGTDSCVYTITDGNGGNAVATLTINVTSVNDNPTVVNDSMSLPEDNGATAINVLANDSSLPDTGETLAITSKTNGTNGVVVITGGGTGITYQPNANFTGNDSFTYTISDGNGGNATATVNVSVTSVNDAPPAVNDAQTMVEDSGATAINVLANDTGNVDTGEVLTITSKTNGTNGVVVITGGGTGITYQPNANFNGNDSFTYTISDGNGGSATATVSVTVNSVNDNPTVVNDSVSLPEDNGATAINVLANDNSLPDNGEVLTITGKTNGINGTVVITGGGTGVTYQPNANFTGTDSFTYTVGDGNSGTATATVNVSVTSVNDAPPTVNDTRTIAEDSGPTIIDVLANDTGNVDSGETLTIAAVSAPSNGTVSIVGNMISYTPNANFNGADLCVYTVSDGHGGNAVATLIITVTSTNDAPTATDVVLPAIVQASPNPAGRKVSALFANLVNDPDSGSSLAGVAIVENSANATTQGRWQYSTNNGTSWFDVGSVADGPSALAIAATARLRFLPVAPFDGSPIPLVVRVLDNSFTGGFTDGSTRQTINTTVTGGSTPIAATLSFIETMIMPDGVGGNTTPILTGVPVSANVNEGQTLNFTAITTDSDAGQTLTYSLVGAPSGASIDPDSGAFTWTTTENDGPDTYIFNVQVSDGLVTVVRTITVMVREVNNTPTLANVPATANVIRGETMTFTATATDTDLISGAPNALTFSLVGAPSGATIDPDTGVVSWTPADTFTPGVYTFNVRVVDDGVPAKSAVRPITVTVASALLDNGVLRIGGTIGNDTITVNPAKNPANITVTLNKIVLGEFALSGVNSMAIRPAAGNDKVTISARLTKPTLIDGGSGNDILTGGAGHDTLLGGVGHDRLTGGVGNNLLVGGDGNDILTGGVGRHVMIGGKGLDRLTGSSGDDLLIAGYTDFDNNLTALGKIMTEWSSAGSYQTRVTNLTTGGGANGTTVLTASTVDDDSEKDILKGATGNDWFFVGSLDTLDLKVGEQKMSF